jgi:hypothetical protein
MPAAPDLLELPVYHTSLRKATLLEPATDARLLLEKALRDFHLVAGLQFHVE